MSTVKPDKKRRRQDSSEDSNVDVVDLVSSSDESDEKEEKGEEINYPKYMLKEIEAVHSKIQKKRLEIAKAASKSSDNSKDPTASSAAAVAPHEVFIAFHQALCTYDDETFDVIGTYSRVEAANEQVLKLFKAEYAQYFNDSSDNDDGSDGGYGGYRSFVKGRPGQESHAEDNQVQWCIDGHGALSLEVQDGGDGAIYKVYTLRQEVRP